MKNGFFGKWKKKNRREEDDFSEAALQKEEDSWQNEETSDQNDLQKNEESSSFADVAPDFEDKNMDLDIDENEEKAKQSDERTAPSYDKEGADEVSIEQPADSETNPEAAAEPPESKGFFARLKEGLNKTRSAIVDRVDTVLASFQTVDEELFEELEEALIMADIGVDTSLYIIGELRKRAKEQGVKEAGELKGILKAIISEILSDQESRIDTSKKPTVIMVIGVNGVGKTTSIGKMAARYKSEGKKVILAAADTFRAAAIDQLQIWAERAGVDIVKHQEGSDPSAVVFDAIAAAKSRGADIVICDTAGRLHNKKNLMEELKKTARVIERETGSADNEVLLVLDGSTGQNALIQAREFASVAKITGVILTKLDGTAKGGVIIALSKEQNIGVKFIGIGEGIDDLREFHPKEFAEALFPEDNEMSH